MRDRHFWLVVGSGALLGLAGVLLALLGNPENSGICVSCFIENSAGALGFHDNPRMQYLRPELVGFVLGSLASALAFREFRSRGGSPPLPLLLAGVFLMVGCAVFVGCPIKLFLRLTAGDLTALAGVAGLVAGVWAGIRCFNQGVELAQNVAPPAGSGLLVPLFFLLLLLFLLVPPSFLLVSSQGSGAKHAPGLVSLGVGTLLGFLAQRSRFCITGALRDTFLMGARSPLVWGGVAFLLVALLTNLGSGLVTVGFTGQPGAHQGYLWSFLGMGLVGWVSVLFGGCPFRQLVKAGQGDADAGLVVVGMFIGGALVESWGLEASSAGVPAGGKMAVLVGLLFVIGGSLLWRVRSPAREPVALRQPGQGPEPGDARTFPDSAPHARPVADLPEPARRV